MQSVKYLEQLRAKLPKQTDQELASLLKVSKGAISHYSTGRRVMDEETCLRVAMELDIDPLRVIAAAGLDRAEKTGQKSMWEVFLKRTAATSAAAVLVSVGLFSTSGDAQAAPLRQAANHQICIM
ncbi:Cro/Cl family transcriptional regulator [Herbaspirillum sp. SJZ099]|uniref:Cro/Cl family transcriptional regulator n=1 Tax=Herbaspirillum sp. SJZ099 TaxID=2572916 RepID=UPI0011A5393E|nr:Cro/Cl family transcriptional regulator [Herbaspirillum sp. SJZ099]TWC72019.1 hypothetical protein FB597_1011004 [Herbaspirillum sp. SJZ099]